MRIKEVEQQKCGKCPLIDVCGDAFENPCLCCESRLAEIDVNVYKDYFFEVPYQNIREKALQLGIDIKASNDIPEEERDEWEEENNCLNNYKLAFMELFLENPIIYSYEEWNK